MPERGIAVCITWALARGCYLNAIEEKALVETSSVLALTCLMALQQGCDSLGLQMTYHGHRPEAIAKRSGS